MLRVQNGRVPPYVLNYELGGYVSSFTYRGNTGLYWKDLGEIIDINKDWTIEFWVSNIKPQNSTEAIRLWRTDGTADIGVGGWYSHKPMWLYNSSDNRTDHSDYWIFTNRETAWDHVAICCDSSKPLQGTATGASLTVYRNGTTAKDDSGYPQNGFYTDLNNGKNIKNISDLMICPGYYADNYPQFKIAQLVVRNSCKYKSNFTPSKKPYILGN